MDVLPFGVTITIHGILRLTTSIIPITTPIAGAIDIRIGTVGIAGTVGDITLPQSLRIGTDITTVGFITMDPFIVG
jgi:hypothetical protein